MLLRSIHILLWSIALFSVLWPGSFAARAALLNTLLVPSSITQVQHVFNSSSLAAGIPSDFNVGLLHGPRGSKLLPTLLLEVAVHVIGRTLAREDFTGRIPAQGWSEANIVISVGTQGVIGNSIERRCVIWGISEGLAKMIRDKDFRSAIFGLEWRGASVGTIAFHTGDVTGIDTQSKSANVSQPVSLGTSSRSNIDEFTPSVPSALGEPILNVRFYWIGDRPTQLLDKYGIYMNLIGALMYSAEKIGSQIIRNRYSISVGDYGVQVVIGAASSSQPHTRAHPMNHGDIITAVTLIPGILASLKASAAFEVVLSFDNVRIGQIVVEPRRLLSPPAPSNSLLPDSIDVTTD